MNFPYQRELKVLTPMELAVKVYKARNLSKQELADAKGFPPPFQPMGVWHPKKKDGVWYPIPLEVRPCCWGIQVPTAKYGWTLHRHCRSIRHIAMLCNVDDRHLFQELGIRKDQARCTCGTFRQKDDYLCVRCRDLQDSLNEYQALVDKS